MSFENKSITVYHNNITVEQDVSASCQGGYMAHRKDVITLEESGEEKHVFVPIVNLAFSSGDAETSINYTKVFINGYEVVANKYSCSQVFGSQINDNGYKFVCISEYDSRLTRSRDSYLSRKTAVDLSRYSSGSSNLSAYSIAVPYRYESNTNITSLCSTCASSCTRCNSSCYSNCASCHGSGGCYNNVGAGSCKMCYDGCNSNCTTGCQICVDGCYATCYDSCHTCDNSNYGVCGDCRRCVGGCDDSCFQLQTCTGCHAACTATCQTSCNSCVTNCAAQDGCSSCDDSCQAECHSSKVGCHPSIFTMKYMIGGLAECKFNASCNSQYNPPECPAYVALVGCNVDCYSCYNSYNCKASGYNCETACYNDYTCTYYVACAGPCMACHASNYTCTGDSCYGKIYAGL